METDLLPPTILPHSTSLLVFSPPLRYLLLQLCDKGLLQDVCRQTDKKQNGCKGIERYHSKQAVNPESLKLSGFTSEDYLFLYKMCYMLFAVTWKKIDKRNLYHSIATRLQTHCRTGTGHKNLSRQGRIVYLHVELKQLVLRCS